MRTVDSAINEGQIQAEELDDGLRCEQDEGADECLLPERERAAIWVSDIVISKCSRY